MKVVDPFSNVSDSPVQGTMYGSELNNIDTLQAGTGDKVMRADSQGLWLGASEFVDAPFRVDMDGNVVMASGTVTGYVTVGGSASDVNNGATTINGSKITAGSITASQIQAGTITATQIASGTITATQIAGETITASQLASGSVDTDALQSNCVTASKILAGSVTASKIDVSSLSAITANLGTVTAGTINATQVTVSNLNASNITSGIYYAGGSGKPSYIYIARDDSSGGNAYMRWEGGSKIWSDTSNRIGVNSLGSPMYIYVASTERIVIPSSGQTTIRGGAYLDGNVNAVGDLRIHDGYKLKMYSNSTQYIDSDSDDMRYQSYDNHEFYVNGTIRAIIDNNIWTDGSLYADGSKPFLISHPDGSDRLLRYTAQESPDVVLRYRGIAEFKANGEFEIIPPQHFVLVTEKRGLVTVNLTSMSQNHVWVKEVVENRKIVIAGTPTEKVMFEILAIRKGYLDAEVEIGADSKEKALYEKYNKVVLQTKQDRFIEPEQRDAVRVISGAIADSTQEEIVKKPK